MLDLRKQCKSGFYPVLATSNDERRKGIYARTNIRSLFVTHEESSVSHRRIIGGCRAGERA